MSDVAFIRRRAKLMARAKTHRARCEALRPLGFAEKLVAMDYAYRGNSGPLLPSIQRVSLELAKPGCPHE